MDDISCYKNLSYDCYCLSPKEGGHLLGIGLGNPLRRFWMPETSQVIAILPFWGQGFMPLRG